MTIRVYAGGILVRFVRADRWISYPSWGALLPDLDLTEKIFVQCGTAVRLIHQKGERS